MLPVDATFILKVAPRFSGSFAAAQARIVSAIGPVFAGVLNGYAINTPLRVAHFMGQVTHECAGFRTTEEFASGAAYEGRKDLGNTQPGDGKKYKGRGLIQLTGRDNYKRIGAALGLALEDNPELAADPVISLRIACEYWKSRNINAQADKDDLIAVSVLVNGRNKKTGLPNGLEDRRNYLRKAKVAIAEMQALIISHAQGGTSPVLRRGSNDDAVGELQTLLNAKGYTLTVDNDFGPTTELAVKQFQRSKQLKDDGIVGSATWAALRAA